MIDPLRWDEFEVSEFFLHESTPVEFEDDQGRLYRANDGRLAAEVIAFPRPPVVCFTLLDAETGQVVTDLSVHVRTELNPRRDDSGEYLYCHECSVLPGIRGYAPRPWCLFYDHLREDGPVLSLRFTVAPRISLQLLDVAYYNRAT